MTEYPRMHAILVCCGRLFECGADAVFPERVGVGRVIQLGLFFAGGAMGMTVVIM